MSRFCQFQRRLTLSGLAFAATACTPLPPGAEPALSPVGTGAYAALDPAMAVNAGGGANSLWRDNAAQLYRDRRAFAVGDIVTVLIDVNDQAALRSSSSRSRTGSAGFGLNLAFDLVGPGREGSISTNGTGQTASSGQGNVQRSERINLSVAATVTAALPNGNLTIAGLQEMRVNSEMRVLGVEGIVRLKDISPANTIRYDQMAEARVSYGGIGRVAEVQQPALFHQIFDRVSPF
jgi:flagellar L-ring protein FlgH